MDRPVQIVLLLVALISLRLSYSNPSKPDADKENTRPASFSYGDNIGGQTCIEYPSPFLLEPASFSPGVQILDFQVNRTSFGFSDANYTQPFDPSLANKKVALACDSVAVDLVATINGVAVSDSLGFQINYGNPDGSMSSSEVLSYGNGALRIVRGNSEFNCTVPSSKVFSASIQGQKILKIDLNDCLAGLGLTLQTGDTVSFKGNFSINPNGPLPSQFAPLPNLRAFGYAAQNGSLLSCDTLTETFTLAKTEVVFDFPNTLNGLPIGCQQGSLDWRLFVPNNDFTDFFGNEFRPATKVDSLVFVFDPGLLSAFGGGQVEVSIPGHPFHGNAYFPIRPLSDFPNGRYVAKFDTLTTVPSLNQVQVYTFDLRLKLNPTCASPTGSSNGDHIYAIQSSINYTDRFYAKFIGDGSCVNSHADQATSSVAYNQPPTIALTPLTPAAAPLTNGLASWDVQICNTSSQSNAGLTWLALEDPSGLLNIGAIANITNPSTPIPVLLTQYGQNYFSFIPALQAGQCLTYRIVATTTTCDDVALNIRSGWNCSSFPNGWNPGQNAPCSSDFLPLSLINTGVSPLQINFDEVKSECNATGERIAISGSLNSLANLSTDNYTLFYVFDENDDGIVQLTEQVIAQQLIIGPISPAVPLVFSQVLQVQPDVACHILLKVESLLNNACSSVSTNLPVPALENAGFDRSFCSIAGTYSTVLGGIVCDTQFYDLTWNALPPAANSMLSDTSVANPSLSFLANNYLGQTLSFVLTTNRMGCGASNKDTVSIVVPDNSNGVFEDQMLVVQVADCQTEGQVCAQIPSVLLPNYLFSDNGLAYTGSLTPCAGGNNLFLAPGNHQIIALDTISGCTDSINVMVTCTTSDTIQVNLQLGEVDTICFDGVELSGSIVTLVNSCIDGQFVDYQILNDSCMVVAGNLVGQESACMVVCDANGFCDTTILEINVSHPFANGILDTVTVTQSKQFCFNAAEFNLDGPIASIENICPNSSGTSVVFSIDTVNNCISYNGLSVGFDTACIELCDNFGNCDTIEYMVEVVPGTVYFDTVYLLLETDTFELPNGWLSGAPTSVVDICPGNNGDNVNFTVVGDEIRYNGFAIGTDTACYRFEDAFGNVALVELRVTVRKTTPDTFCDTIFVGEQTLRCMDTSELPGSFKEGSIVDICPDERIGNVEFLTNLAGPCVYYEGLSEGRDTACVIFCDEFGFCDTSYFCILVKPYFDPPDLGADADSTLKGTPVVIDFLANDTIFGGIEEIYVLDQPVGQVVLNLDNSFTYIPENNSCDWTDVFSYVACNPNGCDTTTVSIYIQCVELTIFTAVSPNNDDVNDVFYIAKIEEFPENQLWVYNIWGNLVYETKTYRNNWPGTWGDDTDLPDGTYFYILEWMDNGTTTVQKGYMELFR
ncbi:MAG: gliding motility-associated C-terminal domain-containing protein [Saprospiraceae bacterium]|nr:gliding motility-associated C-terminal domain-containing protein [Saprospiraceae bacterium]